MSECEGCSFPTATEQVKNATFSLFNVVAQAIKTGKIVADSKVIKERMRTCNACEYKQGDRCLKCGCFLAFKTGLESEQCPKGRW